VGRLAVGTLFAAAALVGLGQAYHWGWLGFGQRVPGVVAPTPSGPEQSRPSTPASVAPMSGPRGAAYAGECLGEHLDRAPCDVQHAADVVAVSLPCLPTVTLAYLGGTAGMDFLEPSVRSVGGRVAGQAVCLLRAPGGGDLPGSAAGSLASRSGDRWRWCRDEDRSADVPCDQRHTEEVVGVDDGTGAALNCPARADAYAGTPLSGEAALQVAQARIGGQTGCVIRVLGNNVLTASVRRLRADLPPVQGR